MCKREGPGLSLPRRTARNCLTILLVSVKCRSLFFSREFNYFLIRASVNESFAGFAAGALFSPLSFLRFRIIVFID